MTYYIGTNPSEVAAGFIKRYFYGLRRNDDGELFFVVVDQLRGGEENVITINDLGIAEENFPDFEEGIDYLDGIDLNHDKVYPNLRYTQFKWENRSLLYYIDPPTGDFIQRISEGYDYPTNISTPAYGDESGDTNVVTTFTNTNPGGGNY